MSNRIPSSLKWLVEKRRRTFSEIIYIEQKLGILLKNEHEKINKLKSDLEALDKTVKLHERIIDPEKITPIRVYKSMKGFKYGEMTRLIYDVLSKAPSKGLTIKEIVDLIISKKSFDINSIVTIESYTKGFGTDLRIYLKRKK